ncbi:hypothetical protein RJ640_001364 [Escallonia rubra]|uniref:Peptidase A3A domain-containing protein n=1 Tax=Escallonia rubra TaxID=112253 RepID=A0AA88RTY9_9ASTE|nr:hypothetical protein RJ640_001364 [Escallonia rubra]
MVKEAIKEEDSSDEDIIGYKTVTIPIRRSMSSRVETIHVMTTTSVNDTVKKKLKEKGLTGNELEKGIQDIINTGASYCLTRPEILSSKKWIEIDQLVNMRMANGDEFEPEYEAYDIPVRINGKQFIIERVIQFDDLDGDFLIGNAFLKQAENQPFIQEEFHIEIQHQKILLLKYVAQKYKFGFRPEKLGEIQKHIKSESLNVAQRGEEKKRLVEKRHAL